MTGAMAGSTAILFRKPTDGLDVLTLTVNNNCNLDCPHCYLQYSGPTEVIDRLLVREVARARYRHLAIVGKEPLLDRASAANCENLIARCTARKKSCSIITNGFGLRLLSAEALAQLAWVDVSLDGGPATYGRYRRGSYGKLVQIVGAAARLGLATLNGLFTLSSETAPFVRDMMAVTNDAPWDRLVFSPYAVVRSQGVQRVAGLPLERVFDALADCESFVRESRAVLLLGADAGVEDGLSYGEVEALLKERGLVEKTIHVPHDPLLLGYLRLTYDGYVLTPYQSLHPAEYRSVGRQLTAYSSLERAYRVLRAG